jgi:hypothetical protein
MGRADRRPIPHDSHETTMIHGALVRLGLAGTVLASAACGQGGKVTPDDGWRSLLPDGSLAAWRGYQSDTVPAGWSVADGVLTKTTGTGDLVSRDEFGDFELTFDWKLAPGGNAGVFYRGSEEYEHIYWTAPEYQLLDDAGHPDGKNRLTSAASAYGLYAPPAGVVKVVEYELWSPDWEAKVKASKFGEWPHYGRARTGHLGIQGDHDGALTIRNMRIRTLP